MRIKAATAMMLLAGTTVRGEVPSERNVTVCSEGTRLLSGTWITAQAVTSRIFADIGVAIEWRQGLRGCPPQGIQISLTDRTPESLKRGALAYALPYEGTHIRVFSDRIVRGPNRSEAPKVLGHVLAHEIAHMLQGSDRHAATGVMRAHWDWKDFNRMAMGPLRFEEHDVHLIYEGLACRAGRNTTGTNAVGIAFDSCGP